MPRYMCRKRDRLRVLLLLGLSVRGSSALVSARSGVKVALATKLPLEPKVYR